MAARPDLMLAAAAAYEASAHAVNSVGAATNQAANELLAEWEGKGALGFRARINYLASATPDAARAYLATATALRNPTARIAEAQALARQGEFLSEQAASAARSTAFQGNALESDATTATILTNRANSMGRQAWLTATAAFEAITGTSPSAKSAVLTSAATTGHAERPHVPSGRRNRFDSQVRTVTEANGWRVYSLDGGLAIPVKLHGAGRFVAGVEAYMPRFEHSPQAAGLSGPARWYKAAEMYCTTVIGGAPQKLRNLFFTDRFSSTTMRQVAGASMFGTTGGALPSEPEVTKNPDAVDRGDGPLKLNADAVANKQITKADEELGTRRDAINLFSRKGPRTNVDVLENGGGLPRTLETVQEYAARSGVDLTGIHVHIVNSVDEARYLDYWNASGQTPPELGGAQFNLGPAAFSNEESLVRNIAHEYQHVLQIRSGAVVDSETLDKLEDEAYASEDIRVQRFHGS